MYKAIIFDFFGVFCPDMTHEWFIKNVPNDDSEKQRRLKVICDQSDNGTLNKADFYQALSKIVDMPVNQIMSGVEAEVKINDALISYASELKSQGYKVACLSNGTQEWNMPIIQTHGLDSLFDEILLSADIGIVKPDPLIYQCMLKKLDCSATEALYVDDLLANTQAAESIGIRSILHTNTSKTITSIGKFLNEYRQA